MASIGTDRPLSSNVRVPALGQGSLERAQSAAPVPAARVRDAADESRVAERPALQQPDPHFGVVVAGWVTRLFESPRLLEISTSRSASRNRKHASLPPATSKQTRLPPCFICRRASSNCGWLGRPG